MPPVSQARRAEEVLPFGIASIGRQVQSLGEAGRLFLLAPEDPILSRIGHLDPFRVYPRMSSDSTVAAAWAQVVTCLLGYGVDLLPASSRQGYGKEPKPPQKRAHRIVQAGLDMVPMFWTVKERVLDANAWGWRPFEIVYKRDLFISSQGRVGGGTRYWRPEWIRDKEPHHFRFNANRDLVYIAGGGNIVFDQPDDAARMWVCRSGSTDCPYGMGIFRDAWLLTHLKSRFWRLWDGAVRKAAGVLILKQGQAARVDLTNPGQRIEQQRQVIADLMAQVQPIMRMLDEEGVLVLTSGLSIEFEKGLSASAETFEGPLKYLDQAIRSVIVLQDLTQSSAKDSSSRAAGEVARKILIDRARQVAGPYVENLNDLAMMICRLNLGDDFDPQDAPYWRWQGDKVANLEAAKVLFDLGACIDGNQLAENAGVPLAKPGDPGALLKSAAAPVLPAAESAATGDPINSGDQATKKQDAGGA